VDKNWHPGGGWFNFPEKQSMLGIVTLALGWLPPYTVAWSANPLLVLGWLLLLRRVALLAS
jgi:hypothetical protein